MRFDGRIAEDFKLSTGTFVSVGPLRARIVARTSPCVQDVVVAGINRDEVGVLMFPRLDECRRKAGLPLGYAGGGAVEHPLVRQFFQALVDELWRHRHRQRQPGRASAAAGWSRRRSTGAKSPTRARSTSARCWPTAPRWSTRCTRPIRRARRLAAARRRSCCPGEPEMTDPIGRRLIRDAWYVLA